VQQLGSERCIDAHDRFFMFAVAPSVDQSKGLLKVKLEDGIALSEALAHQDQGSIKTERAKVTMYAIFHCLIAIVLSNNLGSETSSLFASSLLLRHQTKSACRMSTLVWKMQNSSCIDPSSSQKQKAIDEAGFESRPTENCMKRIFNWASKPGRFRFLHVQVPRDPEDYLSCHLIYPHHSLGSPRQWSFGPYLMFTTYLISGEHANHRGAILS
jgi:hypothetical protein